jgi:hypothetical protein
MCASWPASADTRDLTTGTGCTPSSAVIENDENACDGASEYGLTCVAAGAPSELDCRSLGLVPGGRRYYCCPCR